MNSSMQKLVGAAAILAVWGIFAYLGKTPVDGFISALGSALTGLGVWHVASSGSNQTGSTPATPPVNPGAPQ